MVTSNLLTCQARNQSPFDDPIFVFKKEEKRDLVAKVVLVKR